MDATAEIDAVGAVIDLDQHRQSMGGTGLLAHRLRRPFGYIAAHFARYQSAVEAERCDQLGGIADDEIGAHRTRGSRECCAWPWPSVNSSCVRYFTHLDRYQELFTKRGQIGRHCEKDRCRRDMRIAGRNDVSPDIDPTSVACIGSLA